MTMHETNQTKILMALSSPIEGISSAVSHTVELRDALMKSNVDIMVIYKVLIPNSKSTTTFSLYSKSWTISSRPVDWKETERTGYFLQALRPKYRVKYFIGL